MAYNKFQKLACQNYGGGDYAHIAETGDDADAKLQLESVGDTLFIFIMRELADCPNEAMDSDTAHARLQTATRELSEVADLFETLDN